ncbi:MULTISPECIES: hypothetical protein [Streptomyces]|uniref:Uncharacterized protein n=1 Tax=Streptomyces fradiae ATCC 10745 = DSM 40063 TaxID=1319510 RepID=A0A1Y2NXT5_STRFR|nr:MULTISPECIES: hypothetical protein [Streptomyces]KAF0649193.1 hypothetical protein K701_13875 [Streptomyces fradiae ATCC 10745 = DSM 40063]OSY51819.1 hypothetical protein BG846_02493 [Streptomyces fradiae ATCC 10745 = DSM 40063]
MALRKTIPQDELRDRLTPEQRQQHATDYHSSRGGWIRPKDKPVPGAQEKR